MGIGKIFNGIGSRISEVPTGKTEDILKTNESGVMDGRGDLKLVEPYVKAERPDDKQFVLDDKTIKNEDIGEGIDRAMEFHRELEASIKAGKENIEKLKERLSELREEEKKCQALLLRQQEITSAEEKRKDAIVIWR